VGPTSRHHVAKLIGSRWLLLLLPASCLIKPISLPSKKRPSLPGWLLLPGLLVLALWRHLVGCVLQEPLLLHPHWLWQLLLKQLLRVGAMAGHVLLLVLTASVQPRRCVVVLAVLLMSGWHPRLRRLGCMPPGHMPCCCCGIGLRRLLHAGRCRAGIPAPATTPGSSSIVWRRSVAEELVEHAGGVDVKLRHCHRPSSAATLPAATIVSPGLLLLPALPIRSLLLLLPASACFWCCHVLLAHILLQRAIPEFCSAELWQRCFVCMRCCLLIQLLLLLAWSSTAVVVLLLLLLLPGRLPLLLLQLLARALLLLLSVLMLLLHLTGQPLGLCLQQLDALRRHARCQHWIACCLGGQCQVQQATEVTAVAGNDGSTERVERRTRVQASLSHRRQV
jgi:hypothetical protein